MSRTSAVRSLSVLYKTEGVYEWSALADFR